MNNKTTNVRYLAQLALLAAIEVVMKLMGLGSVPVGPLYMSFLTVPIAVGAMTMGPTAGAILGGVFGLVSMKDAITGVSAMTSVFFQISPINTFVLCVVMRVLMGWCVGLLFRVLRRVDHKKSWSYFVGALSAPLLNTIFFMGYIVLVFYKTDYIQERVASLGVANPLILRGCAGRRTGSDRDYRRLCGRRCARPRGSIVPRSSCTCKSRINDC